MPPIATPSRLQWIVLGLLALAAPTFSSAQDTASPTAWGLFSVRFDTRTSHFIYAAYGYGHGFAMVGALQNPRSGYTELLAAGGRTFAFGKGPSQTIALGAARADDLWYGQLYFLPVAHPGAFWVRATTEWYFPISRGGALQFAVSPVSVTIPVRQFVQAGLSLDLAASRGEKTSTAIGPEVRIALPKAVLGTDLQQVVNSSAKRLRVFFTTAF